MNEPLEAALEASRARRIRALGALERENMKARVLIAKAIAAGMTHRHIADLTGYTFGRIGQIARFEDGDYRKGARRL